MDVIEIINVLLIIFVIVVVSIQNLRINKLDSQQIGVLSVLTDVENNHPTDALRNHITSLSTATNNSLDSIQSQIQTMNTNNAKLPTIATQLNKVAENDESALVQIASLSDRILSVQNQISDLQTMSPPRPFNALAPISASSIQSNIVMPVQNIQPMIPSAQRAVPTTQPMIPSAQRAVG